MTTAGYTGKLALTFFQVRHRYYYPDHAHMMNSRHFVLLNPTGATTYQNEKFDGDRTFLLIPLSGSESRAYMSIVNGL